MEIAQTCKFKKKKKTNINSLELKPRPWGRVGSKELRTLCLPLFQGFPSTGLSLQHTTPSWCLSSRHRTACTSDLRRLVGTSWPIKFFISHINQFKGLMSLFFDCPREMETGIGVV